MTSLLTTLTRWAKRLKQEVITLWFCQRHPKTPRFAKYLAILIVAYAFSPIDLIPDFIPILGYLDDVIIIPIAIYFLIRLIPIEVLSECRQQASEWLSLQQKKPSNWIAAVLIISVWGLAIYGVYVWGIGLYNS